MSSFVAEHAWVPDGADGLRLGDHVRLVVDDDGRWESVRENSQAEAGDTMLPGVSFPGLANTHSHAFHRALRGRTHAMAGGTFWTWREQMYQVADRLDPDSYFLLSQAVFAEMMNAGMTAVGEFHYVHHPRTGGRYSNPNAMDEALMAAANSVGIRITMLDVCYLAGGMDQHGQAAPLQDRQRRFSDGSVSQWLERIASRRAIGTARLGAAIHSVRAVSENDIREISSADLPGPMHIHLSEQPAENQSCLEATGRTPTELLAECGILTDRLTAVHATHLTETDISLLGGARCGISVCPTTERDLADGIGPARALADAGARLSLGSDQHVVIDPFEEMRALEMHERLMTNERGRFQPAELTQIASTEGYRLLDQPRSEFAVGSVADLVSVRTDSIRTIGSRPAEVGFCASAEDVDVVMTAGTCHVVDGRHVSIDAEATYRDVLSRLLD